MGRSVVAVGVAAVLLGGCLTKSQGAKVGAVGFATIATTIVVVDATTCSDPTLHCGLERVGYAAIPITLGGVLLVGGLVNFILGPDESSSHHAPAPIYVPSLARHLMASASVVARKGDCARARDLAARAQAADPVIAAAYAGDPSLATCLGAP